MNPNFSGSYQNIQYCANAFTSSHQQQNTVPPTLPYTATVKPTETQHPTQQSTCLYSLMGPKEKEKYVETFNFPYCEEAGKYEKVTKIGQGTFGLVFCTTCFMAHINDYSKNTFRYN